MSKLSGFKAAALLAAVLAFPSTQAATMSRVDFDGALQKCEALSGDGGAKSMCVEKARQDWQAQHPSTMAKEQRPAGYDAAIKKCDVLSGDGDAKSLCTEAAGQKYPAVKRAERKSASTTTMASYEAAIKKCDTLSGDGSALAVCTEAAKVKHGMQ